MIAWVVRIFLVLAGFIASFFVAKDALNFPIIQMVVAVILFTVFIFIITFWSSIKKFFTGKKRRKK